MQIGLLISIRITPCPPLISINLRGRWQQEAIGQEAIRFRSRSIVVTFQQAVRDCNQFAEEREKDSGKLSISQHQILSINQSRYRNGYVVRWADAGHQTKRKGNSPKKTSNLFIYSSTTWKLASIADSATGMEREGERVIAEEKVTWYVLVQIQSHQCWKLTS